MEVSVFSPSSVSHSQHHQSSFAPIGVTRACKPTEVSVDGVCLPLQHVGAFCQHSSQCLGGSLCRDSTCSCTSGMVEDKKRCVAAKKECATNQVLFDEECLPVVSLGRACVHSSQCRGGGICEDGVCTCSAGTARKLERCKQMETITSTSTTSYRPTVDGSTYRNEATPHVNSLGGFCSTRRLPLLSNGTIVSCTGGRPCPSGYMCMFSKSKHNYFCCSKSAQAVLEESVKACKTGIALLYPKTGQPVTCSRSSQCPSGYVCKRNRVTQLFHCCTVPKPLEMDLYISKVMAKVNFFAPPRKMPRALCPKNFVLIEIREGNKRNRRCQITCPPAMSAVKGVCRANVNGTIS